MGTGELNSKGALRCNLVPRAFSLAKSPGNEDWQPTPGGVEIQSLYACEEAKRQPHGSIGLKVNILTE